MAAEPGNRRPVLVPMANLAGLPLKIRDGLFRVVVETPKGATQKIDYDDELECFFVKRRLPLGIAYPFHFGFFPSTRGEDGDPVDAIVLYDQPAFPGLVLACRIVGALRVAQTEEGKTVRNDRFIVVPKSDMEHVSVADVQDLSADRRAEIEAFLTQSVRLERKALSFLGWSDRAAAERMLLASSPAKKAASRGPKNG